MDLIKEELSQMLQRWKDFVRDAPPSGKFFIMSTEFDKNISD